MKKFLTLLAIGGIASAYAHPGHDLFERGVAHAVTSPFHLLALAGIGVAFAIAAKFVSHVGARKLLRIGALACLLLAMTLALFR
jgi:hydrogenase/urease accessory protein HupE